MNIELSNVTTTYYEHQTSIEITIDDVAYWFTLFAKGSTRGGDDVEYNIEADEDIPFELTDEIKDELINEYLLKEANFT